MKRTQSSRRFARCLAVCSLGALVASSAGGCAQALGIEDTKLDPLAGGGGAGGGAADPCYEPLVPIIWQFSSPITADGFFPLLVLSDAQFRQTAGGVNAPPELLDQRAHVTVDSRSCTFVSPQVGLEPVAGMTVSIDGGLTPVEQDPVQGARPFSFTLTEGPTPSGYPPKASAQGIAGFINLTQGNRTFTVSPPESDGLTTPSSSRLLVLRNGTLTTIQMAPNDRVAPYADLPEGSRWTCVGKQPDPPAGATAVINAIVVDSKLKPVVSGVEFHVCANTLDTDCTRPNAPFTRVNDQGVAAITVDTQTNPSGYEGYLYVTGKLPRPDAPPSCGFTP